MLYPFKSSVSLQTCLAVLLSAGCGAAVTEQTGPPSIDAADSTRIVIDNAVTYQTIDGFGGTTLPLVYPNGDHLGAYRNAAIRRVYGDVGLSLGSLSIGVAETPAGASDRFAQRANDNADPMTLNLAGFDFADLDVLREKILLPAAGYGYDDLTLGPLLNLRYSGSWLQPIRAANYSRYLDEAAENVLAVVQHWSVAYGRTPRLVQLFNEPTSGNGELESNSTQEVVDLVKRIGARLSAAGFGQVKFLVPCEETITRSTHIAQAILGDPAARPYVGVIGYHPYPVGSVYSSPRRIMETSGQGTPDEATRQQLEELQALGRQYGVPIWMTEVSEGPGNNDYSFDAIESVLARAIHIHDNFTYAGAAAFFGMNTIWDSKSHAEHFEGRNVSFLSEQSSLVLVDVSTGQIYTTGMANAIGHYARWLGRGAVRISSTSARPRVIVTAFRDQVRGRIILVAINNEASAQVLAVQLAGAQAAATVTGEVSYGTTRWQAIPSFATASATSVNYAVPARSVVTLAIPLR